MSRHHPSVLAKYLAATGGSTHAVRDEGELSKHPIGSASIFLRSRLAPSQLSGELANFVFIMPNIRDEATAGPVLHGGEWLASFLAMVFSSPTYGLDDLAVIVVSDEGDITNQVPRSSPLRACRAGCAVPSASTTTRSCEQRAAHGPAPLANAGRARSVVSAVDL